MSLSSILELVRKDKWGVDDDQLSIWYCDSSAVNMCWKHLSAVCLILALSMAQKRWVEYHTACSSLFQNHKTECDSTHFDLHVHFVCMHQFAVCLFRWLLKNCLCILGNDNFNRINQKSGISSEHASNQLWKPDGEESHGERSHVTCKDSKYKFMNLMMWTLRFGSHIDHHDCPCWLHLLAECILYTSSVCPKTCGENWCKLFVKQPPCIWYQRWHWRYQKDETTLL